MHIKENFHSNGLEASCLTPTLKMHNVPIGQKGDKTKEERGKRKEKEKDGKKHKSNNIYNTQTPPHVENMHNASLMHHHPAKIN